MSAFRPLVTPTEQLVSQQNAQFDQAADELADVHEPAQESAPELQLPGGGRPLAPPEPQAAQAPQAAPKPTPQEEAAQKFQEAQRIEQRDALLSQMVKEARIKAFKERPDAPALARQYLLEVAGIDRFRQNYSICGQLIQIVIEAPLEADIRLIGRQIVRDGSSERSRYVAEAASDAELYRLAMSLASVTIHEPGNQRVRVSYRKDDVEAGQLVASAGELGCLPEDLEPRLRWQYLSRKVITTGYLFNQIRDAFGQFENLITELVILANEDPDFFFAASSTDG